MLPYDTLAAALDEPLPPGASVRALEDFLINECFGTVRPLPFLRRASTAAAATRMRCALLIAAAGCRAARAAEHVAAFLERLKSALGCLAWPQGLIKGKLDQRKRCLEVHWAAARDMKPGQLARMQATLAQWYAQRN